MPLGITINNTYQHINMADTKASKAIRIGFEEGVLDEEITIASQDDDLFVVPLKAAMESITIEHMLGDLEGPIGIVPIALPSRWLRIILEFCCILSRKCPKIVVAPRIETSLERETDHLVIASVQIAEALANPLSRKPDQLRRNPDQLTDFTRKCDSNVVAWQKEFLIKHANMIIKADDPILIATNDSPEVLVHLLAGANYLNIPQLMDLCAFTIAMCQHGKTTAEMRAFFRITDPGFTPQQEAEMEVENRWLLPDK